mmetsp:Transcript_46881/g.117338  ORF Transcript_46881/g.117338 Transcript_46881/m.117338 type:complete len:282 (-) Transcript_46881:617-1462(-)
MGRQVLLAVAGGEGAFDDTVAWAMRCVVQPQDSLHIASVIRGPPGDMSFTRAFGDYSAIAAGAWQLEREAQEAAARNTLDQVLQIVRDVGFRGEISQVLLKPAQGASYSGAAIVKYARARKVDLAVLGNRKIKGLLKRNLAALRGEASTSAYCAAHLKCPCVVIPQGITPVGHQPALLVESVGDSGTWVAIPAVKSRLPMKLCIEVNLPEPDMLTWSLESLARGPWDEIHLVAVYSTITVQVSGVWHVLPCSTSSHTSFSCFDIPAIEHTSVFSTCEDNHE